METIIGLLFVLLPVIFKLIGNKLEQAGNHEQAGKVREFAQKYLEAEEDDEDDTAEDVRQMIEIQPAPVPQPEIPAVEPVREVVFEEALRALKEPQIRKKKKTPVLLEEETVKKNKEKIDPKKLVIYSEIMKPKYQDQGLV